jgi:nucleoside-diphosphate-sugar epimerase
MEAIQNGLAKAKSALTGASNSGQGKLVLIDGATGYVTTPIIKQFLDHGYRVRAQVRSENSANKVRHSFPGVDESQLEFAIIENIDVPGAYKDAVKGVEGIIHTASPFVLQVEDNERDMLKPALEGTLQVLESAHKYGDQVKKIVITSSFASILDMSKGMRPGYTYSEADWNPATWDEAKNSSDGSFTYCASKKLAEEAAWDFVKKNNPKFGLAAICPPMVYGAPDQEVDIKHLNTSMADIYRFMDGSTKEPGDTAFPGFANVQNVAEAHFRAYESPESGRYLVTSGNFLYQDVCKLLRELLPDRIDKIPDPEATPRVETFKLDNSKAKNVLGLDFIGFEKTITDTVKALVAIESAGKA